MGAVPWHDVVQDVEPLQAHAYMLDDDETKIMDAITKKLLDNVKGSTKRVAPVETKEKKKKKEKKDKQGDMARADVMGLFG